MTYRRFQTPKSAEQEKVESAGWPELQLPHLVHQEPHITSTETISYCYSSAADFSLTDNEETNHLHITY
jgi:hypothetical protein